MQEFTGKVMKGETTVYQAVKGEYEIDEWEPSRPWKGEFEVTSGEMPFLEDDGELIMDDGKRGMMKIVRVRMNSDVVEFRGEGQLEKSKESSYA